MAYTHFDGIMSGSLPNSDKKTVSTVTTANAVTFTAAQILGGVILRDPNGAGRADLFPTAANLLAQLKGAKVGQSIEVHIRNTADAAETITMTANTGTTISGTATIAQNNAKSFVGVFTNVTNSPAIVFYSLGTVVF